MFILKLMLINERIFQLYIKNTSRCSSSTCYFHLVMCVMCPTSSEENTAALSILLRWELLAMKAERNCSANQNIIVHFRVGSGVFFWHLQKISHSGSKKKRIEARKINFQVVMRQQKPASHRSRMSERVRENCVNWKWMNRSPTRLPSLFLPLSLPSHHQYIQQCIMMIIWTLNIYFSLSLVFLLVCLHICWIHLLHFTCEVSLLSRPSQEREKWS